uniref:Arginine-hydroxylase NDUFAF5, mitochondrial n=1 Tax=Hirondellea gigas TaxID=1518452 RepID=A0A2P2HXL0_9CRUS
MQRERAAAKEDAKIYDYLKDEVGYRLADRIFDIKREFDVGLDLGCGRGHLSKNITDAAMKKLYMGEFSPAALESAAVPYCSNLIVEKLHIDEEEPLPFQTKYLDVVLSNLSLHWVNNLPGCLREVRRVLKDDGVLLASMFGGDTLYQLRSSLLMAEMEREGGISSHISPFTEVQDIGGLLGQAGFEELTIDTEDITIGYPSMFELLWDLQGMAENNASVTRKPYISRDTLMAAAALYQEMYGTEEGIPATFQIIYMIGWKPNPNAVLEPAARGSGQVSLKDLSRLDELVKEKGISGKVAFIKELEQSVRRYDYDDIGDGKSGKPDDK